jgi:hypothetical protein
MRAGGVLLVLGGVWVLCQVLGNALERLGVIGAGDQTADAPEFGNVPDKGYSNVPHNAQGYPL